MRPHNKKHNTCGDSKMNLPSYYSKDILILENKNICEILAKPLYTGKYT